MSKSILKLECCDELPHKRVRLTLHIPDSDTKRDDDLLGKVNER